MALPVTSSATGTTAMESARLKQAGQEFEALLLERLLQSSRPARSGPSADWRAMADRQFAHDLAKVGPLGVARLLHPDPNRPEPKP